MNNTSVVSVQQVSKSYCSYPTNLHRFASWFSNKVKPSAKVDVLQGVSFEVAKGEAVALVGENGAGKSTLLKIITGTVNPTCGAVRVCGRIAAILELGLGFNPEMTGRQNVFLAGGVMGFRVEELEALIPDIIKFSELGDYFDKPVRTYSSGMQMRLAFSIATAKRPEILIVDEALSVGDTYFQHKSFARIKEFREQGTSLLFVSHDAGAVQALCDRAVLLEHGVVLKDDKPETVLDFYNALISEKENSTVEVTQTETGTTQTKSGDGRASIQSVRLLNSKGAAIENGRVGEAVTLRLEVDVNAPIDNLVAGFVIKDRLGQHVFGTNTHHLKRALTDVEPNKRLTFNFSFDLNLGVGSYSVAIALHGGDTHVNSNYEWRDYAVIFNVVNADKPNFVGLGWLDTQVDVTE